ncbi:hypothetical protein B0H12DRAFT_219425 [Mycena haematopus]|nr:hypothetical protein B0H12DRAFT_219425 [Mycena haematopus]
MDSNPTPNDGLEATRQYTVCTSTSSQYARSIRGRVMISARPSTDLLALQGLPSLLSIRSPLFYEHPQISGAEISVDVEASLTEELVDVQHAFIRRLLGINSRSMLAVLFSETGLMPIRMRRLLLALARLRYMVQLGPNRRVRWALLDSVDLFAAGKASWAGDLAIMLRCLPTPIRITPADFLCLQAIEAIAKRVEEVVDADIQFDIDGLQKTHLLRGRMEVIEETGAHAVVTRRKRHYLTMVPIPAHRIALTRLLLSDHNLSVERLRYASRTRRVVPREERLCRFCRAAVEDEVHALLDCKGYLPLVQMRESALADMFSGDPPLRNAYRRLRAYEFLQAMVASRRAIRRVAKFVCDVLLVFDTFERYIPDGYNVVAHV